VLAPDALGGSHGGARQPPALCLLLAGGNQLPVVILEEACGQTFTLITSSQYLENVDSSPTVLLLYQQAHLPLCLDPGI
jgi:hypothetical protein